MPVGEAGGRSVAVQAVPGVRLVFTLPLWTKMTGTESQRPWGALTGFCAGPR